MKARAKIKAGKIVRAKRAVRSKRRFITRAEALKLAKQHVRKRLFKGAVVKPFEEANVRPSYPGVEDWPKGGAWAVFYNSTGMVFRSSRVVLVSKQTGRAFYDGSANDEG